MGKDKKLKVLLNKKAQAQNKLEKLYIGFRGVQHESSSDELRYSEIMVWEAYLRDLEKQILELENKGP